jgi:hypothetical protein
MNDQLASWVGDVIAGVGVLLSFLQLRRPRRNKRIVRYRHWKGFGIERTRLDVTDDRRL